MMLSAVVCIVIALSSAPVLACTGYLFLLAVLARGNRPPQYQPPRTRIEVVVPAHNEEPSIGRTVGSLLATDYPAELRRVVVVADNCTDATAESARAAGADVLVRTDTERRGKGYALAYAFARGYGGGWAEAFAIVDADTVVSPNLLRAFAVRFERGASAVQAEYGVSNPTASWRTRLMVIALALFHRLRSLARERLQVSAGLRGNGMAFSRELVHEVPHEAFSIVEDLEYGIRIGQAGHRVHYAEEACVYGEMVSSEAGSRSQRRRWEGGRLAMARQHGFPLLLSALAKRDKILFDLAMDVLVPPLSYLVLAAMTGTGAAVAWAVWAKAPIAWGASAPWALSLCFVSFYVLRGWMLSGVGPRGLLDLLWAPVYVVWKIGLTLRRPSHRKGDWVRTTREDPERP